MAGDYDLQNIWEAMEDDLIASYRRNMARHTAEEMQAGASWPQWQALKFQDLKRYESDIAELLKTYGGRSDRTVTRTMEDNFASGVSHADGLLDDLDVEVSSPADFFRSNERRLGALQTAIRRDMSDAKQAVLRMSDDVFRQTIYKAQTFYSAGAANLWQAVDMAGKDFLSRGLNCIEYSDGRRVNIASYAEMALRASSKKAYMVGEGRRSAEYDVTLCQVTQYSACSETCRPWQGRIYIDDVYAGGQDDGEHTLLSWAIENGLFHPNCRHIKQPWYDGISEELQPIDGAEIGENYAAEQRQREIERYIRQYKRRMLGSLDPREYLRAKNKVQDWQQALRDHLADYPELRRNSARERVWDMGAKPAALTHAAAAVENTSEKNIMEKDSAGSQPPAELRMSDKQLGKKIGKHAQDFGLDAGNSKDRDKVLGIIHDINDHPDEIRYGDWRGQGAVNPETGMKAVGPVWFYIRGKDVLIKDLSGNFVTVMADAVDNKRVQAAEIKKKGDDSHDK